MVGGHARRKRGRNRKSEKEEVNLCKIEHNVAYESVVFDDENEAGDISIQEVFGKKRWMVTVVERQGWRC